MIKNIIRKVLKESYEDYVLYDVMNRDREDPEKIKESEDTGFTDLKLNNIWNRLKLTLSDTSINNDEKQRTLNLIKNGQKSYSNLNPTQRKQLYDKSVEYLNTLEKEKTQTADYLKQRQQQEKEGKEFKTQKTKSGVELKWIGDNYEIYFPNNEVEKQTLNFGTDLDFAKYVFNFVMEYEKTENQEEIYDTLYTIRPRLESMFNKTIRQNN